MGRKETNIAIMVREKERDRLTREAMADVKANRMTDHQAVQAWAESLDSDNPLPAPRCCS